MAVRLMNTLFSEMRYATLGFQEPMGGYWSILNLTDADTEGVAFCIEQYQQREL